MNILEAIEALKKDKVIKNINDAGETVFLLQIHVSPLNKTLIIAFHPDELKYQSKMPEEFDHLSYSISPSIDINSATSELFWESSLEEAMKVIKEHWIDYHKNRE